VVPVVAMAVASTRARAHLRDQACARVPAHVHKGAVKPDPFVSLSLDRSRARQRSAAASRGAALRSTFPQGWCKHRVVLELARPFSCLHARTVVGRGHLSRAAQPFRVCSPRRSTPTRTLATRSHACAFEHAHAPAYTARREPTACAKSPPSQGPGMTRRRAVVPTMVTHAASAPFPCSFPSSPSNTVGTRKPHRGTCCPGVVSPHRRRDHPAPPPLWGFSPNTWRWNLKPRGVWPCTHWTTHGSGRSRSAGSRVARHSRAAALARPHRGEPQKIPAGSLAPRHADRHAGKSWLKATDMDATSVVVASLQHSNGQL
jgi:hypothetical protein